MSCPCGGKSFEVCCGPFVSGEKLPETAEQLMRSRYTAYATGNIEYIKSTTAPADQKDFDTEAAKNWAVDSDWKGFDLISKDKGEATDEEGIIEFVARYKINDKVESHHEVSSFKKIDGRWFFMDGQIITQVVNRGDKVGRNDPCICGSGKKFKKCCDK